MILFLFQFETIYKIVKTTTIWQFPRFPIRHNRIRVRWTSVGRMLIQKLTRYYKRKLSFDSSNRLAKSIVVPSVALGNVRTILMQSDSWRRNFKRYSLPSRLPHRARLSASSVPASLLSSFLAPPPLDDERDLVGAARLSVSRRDAAGRRPFPSPTGNGPLSMSWLIARLNSPYTLPSSRTFIRPCARRARRTILHLISRRSRRLVLRERRSSYPRARGARRRCLALASFLVICAGTEQTPFAGRKRLEKSQRNMSYLLLFRVSSAHFISVASLTGKVNKLRLVAFKRISS